MRCHHHQSLTKGTTARRALRGGATTPIVENNDRRRRRRRSSSVEVRATYGGAEKVIDVPPELLKIGATVYEALLEPLYDGLPLPEFFKDAVEQFVMDEKVHGWTSYTNTPTEEVLLIAFVAFYLTAQPGILGYAFDETVARAIQIATAGNKFGKRGSNVTVGGRIGDGSFGAVYRGRLNSSDRDNLLLKFAKNSTGASRLQRAERHMNERISRDIFVAGGCASYVGSYEEAEDAASPVLVWKYAGDENTLEDYLLERNFPSALEEALFGKSQEESKNFLTTTRVLGAEKKRTSKNGHVVTLLGNWGEHYRFWKQGSKNFLLIRYEDLLKNTENEFEKLIVFLKKFLKVNINKEKMDNIIKTTSFDSLKKMENQGLFKENVINFLTNEKINFFDKGPKNIWENSINKSVRESLERKFQKEMKELNYL